MTPSFPTRRSSDLVPGLVPGTHWHWCKAMAYCIYFLANRKHGTLYIGITNDVARRIWEHRQGLGSRFVKRYGVTRLVYVELHDEIAHAIQREKTMKEGPQNGRASCRERGCQYG